MQVDKSSSVIGGKQFDALVVAIGAREWVIDFGVADDAVGHLRHMRFLHNRHAFIQAAMAGDATIFRIKKTSDVTRLAKILIAVDGRGDFFGGIAHLEMLLVIETVGALGRLFRLQRCEIYCWSYLAVVAKFAGLYARQQVVSDGVTGRGRGVTCRALESFF